MHDNPLYSYTFLFVIFCCFFSNLYDFIVISFFLVLFRSFCIWFCFEIFTNTKEMKSSTRFNVSILKRKLLQNVMMNGNFTAGLIGKINVGDKYCKLKTYTNLLRRKFDVYFQIFSYLNREEYVSLDPERVYSLNILNYVGSNQPESRITGFESLKFSSLMYHYMHFQSVRQLTHPPEQIVPILIKCDCRCSVWLTHTQVDFLVAKCG